MTVKFSILNERMVINRKVVILVLINSVNDSLLTSMGFLIESDAKCEIYC